MPSAYTDWFLSWTAGGAPIDDDTVEASIIGAGMAEYTVVEPTPAQFSEAELRAIRVPVLAVMAGRSTSRATRRRPSGPGGPPCRRSTCASSGRFARDQR